MSEHPWQDASAFAARAHRHQLRRDQCTPYFSHPCRVTLTLAVLFRCDDPIVLTAALLHDTIEDTTTDFDDLASRFGVEVAQCVAALTKNATMPEPTREAAYDRQLAAADWRARVVKLADAYDNLADALDDHTRPEKVQDAVDKARRAIQLAAADHHAVASRTGSALLAALVSKASRRPDPHIGG